MPHKKKLFIQLQDRSFLPDIVNVPEYIRNYPFYHGGVALQFDYPGEGLPVEQGWVARVWDPAVQERFQLLIKKLAQRYDDKIFGINLPETSVDFDDNNPPVDYSDDGYFQGEIDNLKVTRDSFKHSIVMQYVNFFPGEWSNDKKYISRLFGFASQNKIALGGPDTIPFHNVQMKNSYPLFHQYKGKLTAIGMAIQEPDYTYVNPDTGKHFTFSDFYRFSKEYLGATILFWNVDEPFFSDELSSAMNATNFVCSGEDRK